MDALWVPVWEEKGLINISLSLSLNKKKSSLDTSMAAIILNSGPVEPVVSHQNARMDARDAIYDH